MSFARVPFAEDGSSIYLLAKGQDVCVCVFNFIFLLVFSHDENPLILHVPWKLVDAARHQLSVPNFPYVFS